MSIDNSPPGMVFVSYAREDAARVEPLVKHLAARGVNVWWDRNIRIGAPFRGVIQKMLDEAAGVLVVWSSQSVQKTFVHSEADAGLKRGALLPVCLDAGARIPNPFGEIQTLDLSLWDGLAAEPLQPLLDSVTAIVARGPNRDYRPTLQDGDWVINNSKQIVSELSGLTVQLRSIGHLFVTPGAPVDDLRAVFGEVGKTYRVVIDAIQRFVAPAFQTAQIDPKLFLDLERGILRQTIQEGHGHCGLILVHYGRYGGLRDWISDKVSPAELERADILFSRLGTADGDLFRPLEDIGELLTNESRDVANLLQARQAAIAQRRIAEGREKLGPLEEQLAVAMRELQQAEMMLGYTVT